VSQKPKYFQKPNLKFFVTQIISQIWTRTDRNIKQLLDLPFVAGTLGGLQLSGPQHIKKSD
jgi:hypothetical protein